MEPLSVDVQAALGVFLRHSDGLLETPITVMDPNQLLIFRVRKIRAAWRRGTGKS